MSIGTGQFSAGDAVLAERTRLTIPTRVECVEKTVMLLLERVQTLGVATDGNRSQIVTALSEALTNAIVHGNLEICSQLKEQKRGEFARLLAERSSDPAYADRQVDIQAEYDGANYVWTIDDQGPGFDYENVLRVLDSDDPQTTLASGRGILLMRAFMTEVQWSRGGRRVRMSLARQNAVERRAHARQSCLGPMRVLPLRDDGSMDWSEAFEALSMDLSQGGAGWIQRGQTDARRLVLEMHIDGKPIYVPAEVCHLRTLDDQMVQIGCRFTRPSKTLPPVSVAFEEAIDRLLQSLEFDESRSDDRRRHPRATYQQAIQVRTADHPAPRTAIARDLSRTGAAFVADFELALDSQVHLELPAGDGATLRATCQVTRCQRVSGVFHDVGVRFLGAGDSVQS